MKKMYLSVANTVEELSFLKASLYLKPGKRKRAYFVLPFSL
jgi:hypothetical protein